MELQKVKSVAKKIYTRGPELDAIILRTMAIISDIVGGTLGPGGRPVLIERYEHNLPPMVTKDGVTVFRALGFRNATAHTLAESVRDAALRTASEAGDGPQPLWSQVLTPTGFVKMGDIQVGMKICGTNGSIQEVVGVYEKGQKEILEVSFGDGQVVECCADHLWAVYPYDYTQKQILTTRKIAEIFQYGQDYDPESGYFTPLTEVELDSGPDCPPVDPCGYSFGILVAGSVPEIEYIPRSYLFSTRQTRRDILDGIIDTLNNINGNTDADRLFEFRTSSRQLAEDVTFLARSLGRSVWLSDFQPEQNGYKVIERASDPDLGNRIVDVKATGRFTEMRCIKVSNPDNLYITDGFIVTHNTTTATILAEAITRQAKKYCLQNPRVSAQKVVRRLEQVFRDVIEPSIKTLSRKADISTGEGRELLRNVAKVSANGDTELADAVMQCFDLVGDDGNVTIAELNGPSRYEVEKIEGYPITMGFEDSCGKFHSKFINDPASQRTVLEKPVFILYHGRLTEFQSLMGFLDLIGQNWQSIGGPHNVVIVATGFSEQVLTALALNFPEPSSLNVFPLLVPQLPHPNAQLDFLGDLSCITGAKVLDSISSPLEKATLEDLGPGVASIEISRFRSNVVGMAQDPETEEGLVQSPVALLEELRLLRVDELQVQLKQAASELERIYIQERLGKITGGIARLKVMGVSNGELKEKRDRAEDAICAVRGAIKWGCLPGGGWTLLNLMCVLKDLNDPIISNVLTPALMEPVNRLYQNLGVTEEEMQAILQPILERMVYGQDPLVYDLLEGKHIDPWVGGVLDSTPAVLEAIRNSVSIAALAGTLGGTVVQERDDDFERSEAREQADWIRNASVPENPANERW